MKRVCSVILSLVLVLALLGSLAPDRALATSPDKPHTHHWVVNDQGRDATCTESGVVWEYCTICHAQRERTIPPKGHHYTNPWEVRKEPTCTEPGEERNKCTRVNNGVVCGNLWIREIPPLGHDWSDWYVLKAPTKDEPGIEERKCNRCGITEQRPLYGEIDPEEPAIVLNVTIADEQPTYGEGENISYIYEITNASSIPLYIMWVYYYEPDGSNGYTTDTYNKPIAAGETLYFYSQSINVTAADIANFAPTFTVRFQVDAYKSPDEFGNWSSEVPNNGWVAVDAHIGELEAGKGEIELTKTVTNTPENGSFFVENEEVEFLVTVKNKGDAPIYDLEVIDYPWGGKSGDEAAYDLNVFSVLNPADGASYTVKHIVTAEDCLEGTYTNLVQAFGYDKPDHGPEYDCQAKAEAVVDTGTEGEEEDIGDMELYVKKSEVSTPANGSFYTEGEEIEFLVEVWNCQGYPLYDVRVWDEPDGEASFDLGSYAEFGPHQTVNFTVKHTVTAADCAAGIYSNKACIEWNSPEDTSAEEEGDEPNYDFTYCEVDCASTGGSVVIIKEVISTPSNGLFYTEGEEIQYRIRVENKTGDTLFNFELHDTLIGDDALNPPGGYGGFMPDGFTEATYSYTVTKTDAETGEVINTSYCVWFDGDGEPHSKYSQTVITPTGKITGEVYDVQVIKRVISTPANGMYYVEGENVVYEITVINNGTTDMYYVDIIDPLKGSGEDAYIDSLSVLKAGDSAVYTMTHKVTHQEVVDGFILNQARAEFTYDMEKKQIIYSDTVVVDTGGEEIEIVPSLTVIKNVESTPANGAFYVEGEQVVYSVYLRNDNDFDVYDVSIYDDLFDDTWTSAIASYPVLKAGEATSPVTFTYTVTASDVANGGILNQAAAEFFVEIGDEDYLSWSNEQYVLTGKDDEYHYDELTMSLTKSVVNPPANGIAYVENETINYLITFVNSSDHEVTITESYDTVFNFMHSQTTPMGSVTVPAHDSVSFPFTYTVTADDVLAGYVTNLIEVTGTLNFVVGQFKKFYLSDEVTVNTMEGRIDRVREYPVAFKFVTSHPKTGTAYTKDETVTYDVVLYNPTGRIFKNVDCYDILLTDTMFWHSNAGDLGTSPITIHVSYVVTETDVTIGSIYNIGWFTMFDEDYGEMITVYSDEVVVDTVEKDNPPTQGFGDHCKYKLISKGEGAEMYLNEYCSEHGNIEATVDKLFAGASTPEAVSRAWSMAAEIWKRALDSEYQSLIAHATGEKKAALESDYAMFKTLLDAYKARLEAQGKAPDAVNEQLVNLLRDRVCELCYTDATAPEARLDMVEPELAAVRKSASACAVTFDADEKAFFTKEINLCDKHLPLVMAASRILAADAGRMGVDKAATYWTSAAQGSYENLIRAAQPLAGHYLMTERAAFTAVLNARRALYDAYYGDELLSAQLVYRLAQQWAMTVCE